MESILRHGSAIYFVTPNSYKKNIFCVIILLGDFWYNTYATIVKEDKNMQPKKQLILLVLNELNANSDERRPLTQTQIAKNLSGVKYTCDRKTVCRNIKFLQAMGYPIKKSSKGFYFDKAFSVEDIAFVKKAILSADGKAEIDKLEIARKVVDILTKQYRR